MTTVAPAASEKSGFVKEFRESHGGNPMKTWLVFEMLGVLVGGFLSGAIAGRLKFKVEHSPKITSRKRLLLALTGGVLVWLWFSARKRLYKRFGTKRNGSAFTRRIHHYDGNLRNRICPCIFLQKKLDYKITDCMIARLHDCTINKYRIWDH